MLTTGNVYLIAKVIAQAIEETSNGNVENFSIGQTISKKVK